MQFGRNFGITSFLSRYLFSYINMWSIKLTKLSIKKALKNVFFGSMQFSRNFGIIMSLKSWVN